MSESRPDPFTIVFGEMAEERFAPIRTALGSTPVMDAFLMSEPVITLLQELRPEAGLGDGHDDFLAFVFAAYRFWADGCRATDFGREETLSLCNSVEIHPTRPEHASYIQIAPRLIWGSLDGGEHHEPLDGWFSVPTPNGIQVVAAFGVHADRPGLSVLVVEGRIAGAEAQREDGSQLFSPTMAGGDAAELRSVASLEELLLLAWRANGARKGT